MTLVSSPPSEEERRLLREYRLTTVPSRRSSCSPATSNASSSTTTTTINLIDQHQLLQQQPQIITATVAAMTTTPLAESYVKPTDSASVNTNSNSNTTGATHDQKKDHTNLSPSPPLINKSYQSSASTEKDDSHKASDTNGINNTNNIPYTNGNGHHHNHKHHHHHHHHHSTNHRRHKASTPTLELTPDELNRMLELSSKLSYLKLVSPQSMPAKAITNGNDGENSTTVAKGNEKVMKHKKPCERDNNLIRDFFGLTDGHTVSNYTSNQCINPLMAADSCHVYIFEKVDYIKKINIRRKAIRKLKKARNKSRASVSPNNASAI